MSYADFLFVITFGVGVLRCSIWHFYGRCAINSRLSARLNVQMLVKLHLLGQSIWETE